MSNAITLQQFEDINELFNSCLHRPDLAVLARHPLASAEYMREVYHRPEWKLFDACVDAIGYSAAEAFPDTITCAANILTDCWIGKTNVVDVLEAV